MATNKAYIDTTFTITVRVPVDVSDLPTGVKEGDEISDRISDDVWNEIVNTSLDVMDGPNAENIENMVVIAIEGSEDDDPEDEAPDAIYDDSPEYVHDAAIDWLYGHAEDYEDRGDALWACKCALDKEGYHIFSNCECEWAVEDAFDDYDGEVGWEE